MSCSPAPESPSSPATSIASPGRAPLRRLMCASAMRPMAVTLIVMPAAERVVSPQRFALPDGEHGAIVADPFEPVVGQSGEEFFYVVYESEFGHGSRVCPAAAPCRPVRVFGFFTCGCRPGGGVPAWGRERSLCEPQQGRGRRLKSLFNGRCRTKVLKIL